MVENVKDRVFLSCCLQQVLTIYLRSHESELNKLLLALCALYTPEINFCVKVSIPPGFTSKKAISTRKLG